MPTESQVGVSPCFSFSPNLLAHHLPTPSSSYCSQRQICVVRAAYSRAAWPHSHPSPAVPFQSFPFSHSLVSECPRSNPSSLAMEARRQPPASNPPAPLQISVWPLALPRCLNHPCAVACVPMLRRVCRSLERWVLGWHSPSGCAPSAPLSPSGAQCPFLGSGSAFLANTNATNVVTILKRALRTGTQAGRPPHFPAHVGPALSGLGM